MVLCVKNFDRFGDHLLGQMSVSDVIDSPVAMTHPIGGNEWIDAGLCQIGPVGMAEIIRCEILPDHRVLDDLITIGLSAGSEVHAAKERVPAVPVQLLTHDAAGGSGK